MDHSFFERGRGNVVSVEVRGLLCKSDLHLLTVSL